MMMHPRRNRVSILFRRGGGLPWSAPYGAPSFPLWAGVLLFLVFYVWPLLTLVETSVDCGAGFGKGYVRVFQDRGYLPIIANTIKISSLVAVCCILVGVPYAVLLSRLRGVARQATFIAGLLPVFVNPLAVICAWRIILERHGIANSALVEWGLTPAPLPLCYNLFSVILVMTYMLFPLVIYRL